MRRIIWNVLITRAVLSFPVVLIDEKVIQEFSLRGKPVYLHVRHRRWYDKATGEPFSYTYDDLAAEGTKLTPEFVSFLKEED